MTSNLSRRWFVAHTHPRAETKATLHLARQGFEIYFPRNLKRRRHAAQDRDRRGAAVSSLRVRCRRYGGAALALNSFHHRDRPLCL